MKRILMLKDSKGCEDGNPEVKEFKEGARPIVTDGLAQAFTSGDSPAAKLLGDPEEEELLGTGVKPELTDNVLDDAAARIYKGDFVDHAPGYVASSIASHYGADKADVQAKLDERVAKLAEKAQQDATQNKQADKGKLKNK